MRDERPPVATCVFFTLKLLAVAGVELGDGLPITNGGGLGGGRTDWDVKVRDFGLAVIAWSTVLRLLVSTSAGVLIPISSPLALSSDCRCA